MATNNPPRFVPTLTEAAPSVTPTSIEDSSYFYGKDAEDSMLDLDLSDLDAPVSQIEKVSPLGAYQGSRVIDPRAVSQTPVSATVQQTQIPAGLQSRPASIPSAADPVARVTPRSAQTAVQSTPVDKEPQGGVLPPDWQQQLRASVQQIVRQELQQQMPFLLLQWSKQIEDKLTPHLHKQLINTIQNWQKQSGNRS